MSVPSTASAPPTVSERPAASTPPTASTSFVPDRAGPLTRGEARLARSFLAPTVLIVAAVVLLPLLATFWISVKPVQLSDLRTASPIVRERVQGSWEAPGDAAQIQYRVRNTSQTAAIRQVEFVDTLPAGLTLTELDPRCTAEGRTVTCVVGDLDPGGRDSLTVTATADATYIDNPVRLRDDEAVATGQSDNVLTDLEFTLANFERVFDAREFWEVLWVTFAYTLFGTVGALVLGLFAAQLLNQSFFGRPILRGLFLFPYVAPVIAMAFTWIILLDPFSGAVNALLMRMEVIDQPISFFGERSVPVSIFGLEFGFPLALSMVIAFEAWRYFPLSFLFILARMQSIPTDMYEAAEIDGASPLQQFWQLSLPQLFGILAVLFLLRFIWTFNKFDDIFLLTGGNAGTRTLTVAVYEQGFALNNLGAGAAVAVIIFVLLFTFALIYFRSLPKEEGL